jgi:hypothetical protein
LQHIEDKHADQPAKKMRHPAAYTCCLCWTAVVGYNSIFKNVCLCRMFCAMLWSALRNLSVNLVISIEAHIYPYACTMHTVCV